jgi:ferredoxin
VQASKPGDGTPRLAAVHIGRQRAGMIEHLCHVCGRRTPARDRYIFPFDSGGFVTIEDDTQRYAGNVPPLHLACARRAQRLCPHLRAHLARPVPYPDEDSVIVPLRDAPEGMLEVAKGLPGGRRVVFSCLRIHGPRFSRNVERLRSQGGNPA